MNDIVNDGGGGGNDEDDGDDGGGGGNDEDDGDDGGGGGNDEDDGDGGGGGGGGGGNDDDDADDDDDGDDGEDCDDGGGSGGSGDGGGGGDDDNDGDDDDDDDGDDDNDDDDDDGDDDDGDDGGDDDDDGCYLELQLLGFSCIEMTTHRIGKPITRLAEEVFNWKILGCKQIHGMIHNQSSKVQKAGGCTCALISQTRCHIRHGLGVSATLWARIGLLPRLFLKNPPFHPSFELKPRPGACLMMFRPKICSARISRLNYPQKMGLEYDMGKIWLHK